MISLESPRDFNKKTHTPSLLKKIKKKPQLCLLTWRYD